ncbi:MAG: TetR/AcrR family transcriptional regulator [Solirubrobacteraceae bacterium]
MSSTGPRSTRDRPAKAPLSEDVILKAALRILRAEGLEAVTMRRLASELDTGPASLYVYISGRDELRNAMLDRVAGLVELEDPDPARWREQVQRLLHRMLRAMETHPGIATVAVANPPTGEQAMRFADNLVGLLRAGGVRDRDAAWSCDILPLIVTASAVESAVHHERHLAGESDTEFIDRITRAFTSLSAQRYPNLAPLGADLTSGDGDERFRFAIDVFLDGLVARAHRG